VKRWWLCGERRWGPSRERNAIESSVGEEVGELFGKKKWTALWGERVGGSVRRGGGGSVGIGGGGSVGRKGGGLSGEMR